VFVGLRIGGKWKLENGNEWFGFRVLILCVKAGTWF